jgi:hypothetical protein
MPFERQGTALHEGQTIVTVDNHKLGQLKETHGSYFKVGARLKKDYWLSSEYVVDVNGDVLVLSFPSKELGEHKLPEPGMEPDEDPLRGITPAPLIGDADQEAQRERMERELAGQRDRVAASALHPKHEVPGAAPTSATEQQRVRGESVSAAEFAKYRGRDLVDAGGVAVGTIDDVYVDDANGDPAWIVVRTTGGIGGRSRIAAPVRGSYVLEHAIAVPYTREQVTSRAIDEGEISRQRAAELYGAYGLPEHHASAARPARNRDIDM